MASGRFATCVCGMTAPSVASLVLISCVDSATVIVSATSPICSSTSRRARWPTSSVTTCENLLEAAQLDVDLIAAGIQVDDLIAAGLGRLLVRLEIGRQIGHRHRRAGHDAAARVLDDAGQRRAVDLREGAGNVQQKHGNHQQQAVRHPFHEHPPEMMIDHCALSLPAGGGTIGSRGSGGGHCRRNLACAGSSLAAIERRSPASTFR